MRASEHDMTTETLIVDMAPCAELVQAVDQCRSAILMRSQVVLDLDGRRDPQPGFCQRWWRASADPESSVMLVVDEALPCAWVEVSAADASQCQLMTSALRDHLATLSTEQLSARLQDWPPPRGAMAALAIGLGHTSPALETAVDRALREGHPARITEAAFAAATARLTAQLPSIKAALLRQADPAARGALARAAEDLTGP